MLKSVLIAAAVAVVLPLPAVAQSLNDTHETVWQPSGKTPAAVYRERGRPACAATVGHHQAGKTAMPAAKKCAVEATKASITAASEAGVAR